MYLCKQRGSSADAYDLPSLFWPLSLPLGFFCILLEKSESKHKLQMILAERCVITSLSLGKHK